MWARSKDHISSPRRRNHEVSLLDDGSRQKSEIGKWKRKFVRTGHITDALTCCTESVRVVFFIFFLGNVRTGYRTRIRGCSYHDRPPPDLYRLILTLPRGRKGQLFNFLISLLHHYSQVYSQPSARPPLKLICAHTPTPTPLAPPGAPAHIADRLYEFMCVEPRRKPRTNSASSIFTLTKSLSKTDLLISSPKVLFTATAW